MNFRISLLLLLLCTALFVNCKSDTQKKKSHLTPELDSIENANTTSVLESGNNVTKAYVDSKSGEFALDAQMRKDHRFYGYEKPDTNSKRLILFSIFTNDVEGNPFDLELGAYYSTHDMTDTKITYLNDTHESFIETEIEGTQGKKRKLYFEKKWVVIDNEIEEYTDEDNYDVDDDVLREYGKVVKFEDGVYPMYILTVDFVERNFTQDFNLNIEAVSIDGETLNNLPGKYATIYYTSELEESLYDIHFKGKSLYGEYAPELDSSWKKITGTLKGAQSLSGDLPSKVTITSAEGVTMNFELYVDDTVQKANNQEVTVYYDVRAINTITKIVPSED